MQMDFNGNKKLDASEFEQALAAYLMAQVADYKRVRHWRFLEALPRNALGKVQKRRLLD